jgi:ribonuclease T2
MNKVISLSKTLNSLLLLAIGLVLYMTTSFVYANPLNGYVMEIQMTPATCLIDATKTKRRECLEGYALNIIGLYPETTSSNCRTNSSAILPPIQAKVVASVMPNEAARVNLWKNIGGCIPMNASQYFRYVINLADRLNIPIVMTRQESTHIQQNMLRTMFTKLNSGLPMQGIHFQCSNHRNISYLTHIKICYNKNGKYKVCADTIESKCPKSFVIKGSY